METEQLDIEKAWAEKRKNLKDLEELAEFDDDCEKSRRVYRAMKKTGLWPDRYRVEATCSVLNDLLSQSAYYYYDLKKFWNLLQESLNAAIQGKAWPQGPCYYDLDRISAWQHMNDARWSDILWKISIVKKLVDAGVTEFTQETPDYIQEKWNAGRYNYDVDRRYPFYYPDPPYDYDDDDKYDYDRDW